MTDIYDPANPTDEDVGEIEPSKPANKLTRKKRKKGQNQGAVSAMYDTNAGPMDDLEDDESDCENPVKMWTHETQVEAVEPYIFEDDEPQYSYEDTRFDGDEENMGNSFQPGCSWNERSGRRGGRQHSRFEQFQPRSGPDMENQEPEPCIRFQGMQGGPRPGMEEPFIQNPTVDACPPNLVCRNSRAVRGGASCSMEMGSNHTRPMHQQGPPPNIGPNGPMRPNLGPPVSLAPNHGPPGLSGQNQLRPNHGPPMSHVMPQHGPPGPPNQQFGQFNHNQNQGPAGPNFGQMTSKQGPLRIENKPPFNQSHDPSGVSFRQMGIRHGPPGMEGGPPFNRMPASSGPNFNQMHPNFRPPVMEKSGQFNPNQASSGPNFGQIVQHQGPMSGKGNETSGPENRSFAPNQGQNGPNFGHMAPHQGSVPGMVNEMPPPENRSFTSNIGPTGPKFGQMMQHQGPVTGIGNDMSGPGNLSFTPNPGPTGPNFGQVGSMPGMGHEMPSTGNMAFAPNQGLSGPKFRHMVPHQGSMPGMGNDNSGHGTIPFTPNQGPNAPNYGQIVSHQGLIPGMGNDMPGHPNNLYTPNQGPNGPNFGQMFPPQVSVPGLGNDIFTPNRGMPGTESSLFMSGNMPQGPLNPISNQGFLAQNMVNNPQLLAPPAMVMEPSVSHFVTPPLPQGFQPFPPMVDTQKQTMDMSVTNVGEVSEGKSKKSRKKRRQGKQVTEEVDLDSVPLPPMPVDNAVPASEIIIDPSSISQPPLPPSSVPPSTDEVSKVVSVEERQSSGDPEDGSAGQMEQSGKDAVLSSENQVTQKIESEKKEIEKQERKEPEKVTASQLLEKFKLKQKMKAEQPSENITDVDTDHEQGKVKHQSLSLLMKGRVPIQFKGQNVGKLAVGLKPKSNVFAFAKEEEKEKGVADEKITVKGKSQSKKSELYKPGEDEDEFDFSSVSMQRYVELVQTKHPSKAVLERLKEVANDLKSRGLKPMEIVQHLEKVLDQEAKVEVLLLEASGLHKDLEKNSTGETFLDDKVQKKDTASYRSYRHRSHEKISEEGEREKAVICVPQDLDKKETFELKDDEVNHDRKRSASREKDKKERERSTSKDRDWLGKEQLSRSKDGDGEDKKISESKSLLKGWDKQVGSFSKDRDSKNEKRSSSRDRMKRRSISKEKEKLDQTRSISRDRIRQNKRSSSTSEEKRDKTFSRERHDRKRSSRDRQDGSRSSSRERVKKWRRRSLSRDTDKQGRSRSSSEEKGSRRRKRSSSRDRRRKKRDSIRSISRDREKQMRRSPSEDVVRQGSKRSLSRETDRQDRTRSSSGENEKQDRKGSLLLTTSKKAKDTRSSKDIASLNITTDKERERTRSPSKDNERQYEARSSSRERNDAYRSVPVRSESGDSLDQKIPLCNERKDRDRSESSESESRDKKPVSVDKAKDLAGQEKEHALSEGKDANLDAKHTLQEVIENKEICGFQSSFEGDIQEEKQDDKSILRKVFSSVRNNNMEVDDENKSNTKFDVKIESAPTELENMTKVGSGLTKGDTKAMEDFEVKTTVKDKPSEQASKTRKNTRNKKDRKKSKKDSSDSESDVEKTKKKKKKKKSKKKEKNRAKDSGSGDDRKRKESIKTVSEGLDRPSDDRSTKSQDFSDSGSSIDSSNDKCKKQKKLHDSIAGSSTRRQSRRDALISDESAKTKPVHEISLPNTSIGRDRHSDDDKSKSKKSKKKSRPNKRSSSGDQSSDGSSRSRESRGKKSIERSKKKDKHKRKSSSSSDGQSERKDSKLSITKSKKQDHIKGDDSGGEESRRMSKHLEGYGAEIDSRQTDKVQCVEKEVSKEEEIRLRRQEERARLLRELEALDRQIEDREIKKKTDTDRHMIGSNEDGSRVFSGNVDSVEDTVSEFGCTDASADFVQVDEEVSVHRRLSSGLEMVDISHLQAKERNVGFEERDEVKKKERLFPVSHRLDYDSDEEKQKLKSKAETIKVRDPLKTTKDFGEKSVCPSSALSSIMSNYDVNDDHEVEDMDVDDDQDLLVKNQVETKKISQETLSDAKGVILLEKNKASSEEEKEQSNVELMASGLSSDCTNLSKNMGESETTLLSIPLPGREKEEYSEKIISVEMERKSPLQFSKQIDTSNISNDSKAGDVGMLSMQSAVGAIPLPVLSSKTITKTDQQFFSLHELGQSPSAILSKAEDTNNLQLLSSNRDLSASSAPTRVTLAHTPAPVPPPLSTAPVSPLYSATVTSPQPHNIASSLNAAVLTQSATLSPFKAVASGLATQDVQPVQSQMYKPPTTVSSAQMSMQIMSHISVSSPSVSVSSVGQSQSLKQTIVPPVLSTITQPYVVLPILPPVPVPSPQIVPPPSPVPPPKPQNTYLSHAGITRKGKTLEKLDFSKEEEKECNITSELYDPADLYDPTDVTLSPAREIPVDKELIQTKEKSTFFSNETDKKETADKELGVGRSKVKLVIKGLTKISTHNVLKRSGGNVETMGSVDDSPDEDLGHVEKEYSKPSSKPDLQTWSLPTTETPQITEPSTLVSKSSDKSVQDRKPKGQEDERENIDDKVQVEKHKSSRKGHKRGQNRSQSSTSGTSGQASEEKSEVPTSAEKVTEMELIKSSNKKGCETESPAPTPARRLTRREAALKNVVLPPVMSKEMPGRKGMGRSRRSSSLKESESGDSSDASSIVCENVPKDPSLDEFLIDRKLELISTAEKELDELKKSPADEQMMRNDSNLYPQSLFVASLSGEDQPSLRKSTSELQPQGCDEISVEKENHPVQAKYIAEDDMEQKDDLASASVEMKSIITAPPNNAAERKDHLGNMIQMHGISEHEKKEVTEMVSKHSCDTSIKAFCVIPMVSEPEKCINEPNMSSIGSTENSKTAPNKDSVSANCSHVTDNVSPTKESLRHIPERDMFLGIFDNSVGASHSAASTSSPLLPQSQSESQETMGTCLKSQSGKVVAQLSSVSSASIFNDDVTNVEIDYKSPSKFSLKLKARDSLKTIAAGFESYIECKTSSSTLTKADLESDLSNIMTMSDKSLDDLANTEKVSQPKKIPVLLPRQALLSKHASESSKAKVTDGSAGGHPIPTVGNLEKFHPIPTLGSANPTQIKRTLNANIPHNIQGISVVGNCGESKGQAIPTIQRTTSEGHELNPIISGEGKAIPIVSRGQFIEATAFGEFDIAKIEHEELESLEKRKLSILRDLEIACTDSSEVTSQESEPDGRIKVLVSKWTEEQGRGISTAVAPTERLVPTNTLKNDHDSVGQEKEDQKSREQEKRERDYDRNIQDIKNGNNERQEDRHKNRRERSRYDRSSEISHEHDRNRIMERSHERDRKQRRDRSRERGHERKRIRSRENDRSHERSSRERHRSQERVRSERNRSRERGRSRDRSRSPDWDRDRSSERERSRGYSRDKRDRDRHERHSKDYEDKDDHYRRRRSRSLSRSRSRSFERSREREREVDHDRDRHSRNEEHPDMKRIRENEDRYDRKERDDDKKKEEEKEKEGKEKLKADMEAIIKKPVIEPSWKKFEKVLSRKINKPTPGDALLAAAAQALNAQMKGKPTALDELVAVGQQLSRAKSAQQVQQSPYVNLNQAQYPLGPVPTSIYHGAASESYGYPANPSQMQYGTGTDFYPQVPPFPTPPNVPFMNPINQPYPMDTSYSGNPQHYSVPPPSGPPQGMATGSGGYEMPHPGLLPHPPMGMQGPPPAMQGPMPPVPAPPMHMVPPHLPGSGPIPLHGPPGPPRHRLPLPPPPHQPLLPPRQPLLPPPQPPPPPLLPHMGGPQMPYQKGQQPEMYPMGPVYENPYPDQYGLPHHGVNIDPEYYGNIPEPTSHGPPKEKGPPRKLPMLPANIPRHQPQAAITDNTSNATEDLSSPFSTRVNLAKVEVSESPVTSSSDAKVVPGSESELLSQVEAKTTNIVDIKAEISSTEAYTDKEMYSVQPAAATSSDQSESTPPMTSSEAGDKLLKVKSRWRRASEAEKVDTSDTPPPPPPPPPPPKNDLREKKPTKLELKAAIIEENMLKSGDKKFETIEESIHLTERRQSKQMREVRRMVCDCSTSKEDRENGVPACGDDCLNRMLFIECGSRCPCGEYCTNKRFQKKEYAKVEPFQTDWKGMGLRTIEDLEPGRLVMEYLGEVLDYNLFKKRTKVYAKQGQEHFYFMALNSDEIIDATYKGNISRYINHSCDPNCETQKWTVNGNLRVGFFTRKRITAGAELTFDYQYEVYGKEAQKCFCGSDSCRGFIGGTKRSPLKIKKKTVEERRKEEMFEEYDKLEEEIEQMSELQEGLRNKMDVLSLCRLMVRAEDPEHRKAILTVLQNTTEPACFRLFLDYHGLELLWSWMTDNKQENRELLFQILSLLKLLPIGNKTILKESKILNVVERLSNKDDDEGDATSDSTVTRDSVPDSPITPLPVLSTKVPVSILSSFGFLGNSSKHPKKKVKFADEASSSDSESRTSASEISDVQEFDNVSSTSQISKPPKKKEAFELRRQLFEMKEFVVSAESGLKDENLVDSQQTNQESIESSLESDKLDKELCSRLSVAAVESSVEERLKIVTDSEEIEDKDDDKDLTVLAASLLESWVDLKEVYKIPKKERVEERKKTELELDQMFGDSDRIGRSERYKAKVSGWDTGRKRKRESSKDDPEPRKVLLPTPKISKEERRQMFEAQVKEQDEIKRQQDEIQRQQMLQQQEVLLQQQQQLLSDPTFLFYLQQDPSLLQALLAQGLQLPGLSPGLDSSLAGQFSTDDPNFLAQQQQALLLQQTNVQLALPLAGQEALGMEQGDQGLGFPQLGQQPQTPEQQLTYLQQLVQIQQQLQLQAQLTAMASASADISSQDDTEDDVPPPPSPPRQKPPKLPPNWKTAKDTEGKVYYYHTITRQTQWDPPALNQGDLDSMELEVPVEEEIVVKVSKKKTTTAAADTSSEMSKKLKEAFRNKMSSFIVLCLNPFRKPDCKLGRITNTEDFKHLARKLTHHVMAKELKHCRHVEDLEVNENVKAKAKDYVKKYMVKFGSVYKKSSSSPTDD